MEAGPRAKGRREGWAVAKPAGFNAARHTGEVDEALRQTCMSLWASARMDQGQAPWAGGGGKQVVFKPFRATKRNRRVRPQEGQGASKRGRVGVGRCSRLEETVEF